MLGVKSGERSRGQRREKVKHISLIISILSKDTKAPKTGNNQSTTTFGTAILSVQAADWNWKPSCVSFGNVVGVIEITSPTPNFVESCIIPCTSWPLNEKE